MDLAAQKRRIQNRNTALFLMVPTAVLAKIIQLFFLPEKYFYDSWRMIDMLVNGEKAESAWAGYQMSVDIHQTINILNLSSMEQFSIFYGLLMTPLMMFVVSRTKEMNMRETVFTLMATGVLNIYVFNINKEMIQIVFFLFIYIAISIPINNTFIKIIGCALIYYWESSVFRPYYIIMAALCIATYCVFLWLRHLLKIKIAHIFIAVVVLFTAVFIFFYASSFISPDDYYDALNVRDGTTSTIDDAGGDGGGATSAIRNLVRVNGNLGIFMYDYVINSIRMMFPVELLFKGIGYVPFVFYQLFILLYVFKTIRNLKHLDGKVLVALSGFVAYFLGSAVFEPDFGSWVRHEATTFPILQFLAYNSRVYEEIDNNETKNV